MLCPYELDNMKKMIEELFEEIKDWDGRLTLCVGHIEIHQMRRDSIPVKERWFILTHQLINIDKVEAREFLERLTNKRFKDISVTPAGKRTLPPPGEGWSSNSLEIFVTMKKEIWYR